MRIGLVLVLGAICLAAAGCCTGVYSRQDFGAEGVAGATLQEVISRYGPPDRVAGNGEYLVLTYTRQSGRHILSLFAETKKKSTGIVVDRTGKVIATGVSPEGSAFTILGATTSPIVQIENK